MKKFLLGLCMLSFGTFAQDGLEYSIDLTQNPDTFYVHLDLHEKLKNSNGLYQFAATAPGTYQTQNIGRFVSDFKAYDKKGNLLNTEFVAPNQYKIDKPKKVRSISYKVAETFDTPVESFPVYMMCGSTIEKDNALINIHTVLGYFHGKQDEGFRIKVIGQPGWKMGTALPQKSGYFEAESFDHGVDSPILCGELSFAETQVADTPIRLYTYSSSGKLNSADLLERMEDMLHASQKFLVKLPVDNYTFLYYFMPDPDGVTGAWEHSYSSEYVLGEEEPTEEYMKQVTDIASHEFFHIVTPLNIHSEIIEQFNFVNPTPSEHLWLYEGTTEWASNILLYRGGVVDLDTYLKHSIAQKIVIDKYYFDTTWSLVRIAEESFNEEGAKQYGNIYYKGSLTAGYLDILLLELSDGKRGFREVILELVKKYGKGNPFSEKTFFADLEAMTYPEVGEFIDLYIKKATPLPHAEFLGKLGLSYKEEGKKIEIKKMDNPSPEQAKLFEAWSKNMPLN
ncbi:peptidase [Marinilongibacter aquaticus]|uniref:M61 family metallopeptidase n=1 Tax=Marinilongibacter aquaticus TaxID=2975157 RepID=UPI0021BD81C2|nr:peptidase [Marinilongibacter aquaticus]UBM58947.1 peptidase [Marinilongibacter aquaticus]